MYDTLLNLPKLLVRFPITRKLILSSLLLGLLSTLSTGAIAQPAKTPVVAQILQKVSDEVDVAELQHRLKAQGSAGEGKRNMGAMNRAQQAYYLEKEKFATTIKELGIGIKLETENYRYQILPQGNQRERVMMTARAKRPELRSYTGAVFAVKTRGKDIITLAGICETDKPSSTPPAMPATPRKGMAEFQCPAGSHLLVR